MDTPADRIRVIEGSLRCFTYGCLSFVPALGLVFSVLALLQAYLAERGQASGWNPASRYLLAGYVLAWIGGLIWLGLLLLVLATQLEQFL